MLSTCSGIPRRTAYTVIGNAPISRASHTAWTKGALAPALPAQRLLELTERRIRGLIAASQTSFCPMICPAQGSSRFSDLRRESLTMTEQVMHANRRRQWALFAMTLAALVLALIPAIVGPLRAAD